MSVKIERSEKKRKGADADADDRLDKYGISNLPRQLQSSFTKIFAPRYIEAIGMSDSPWETPGAEFMQRIFDNVYPNFEYDLFNETAIVEVVRFVQKSMQSLRMLTISQ